MDLAEQRPHTSNQAFRQPGVTPVFGQILSINGTEPNVEKAAAKSKTASGGEQPFAPYLYRDCYLLKQQHEAKQDI